MHIRDLPTQRWTVLKQEANPGGAGLWREGDCTVPLHSVDTNFVLEVGWDVNWAVPIFSRETLWLPGGF